MMIRRNPEASGSRNGGRERTLARGKQSHENKDVNMADNDGEDDVTSGTKLDLSKKELPAKNGLIEAFSRLKQLQRLDMSDMQPSIENENPNGLDNLAWLGKAVSKSKRGGKSGTPYFGQKLTWLKFSDNSSLGKHAAEKSWEGLEQFSNLTVLNASSCDLPIAPPSFTLMAWQSLGALVLGHNSIKSLPHFPSLPQLNTIVLSHNQITSLPKDLPANLPGLKKLSITHNLLQWTDEQSPLPDFSICSHLREVRISGNSQLNRLPNHMSGWGKGVGKESKGTGLETFEAGDCGLNDWNSISALLVADNSSVETGDGIHPSRLRRLRGLTTLSLRGNDVTKQTDYREKILQAHPALRVLDSVKLKDESKMQEEFKATIEKLAAPPRPEKVDHSDLRDRKNNPDHKNSDEWKRRSFRSDQSEEVRQNRFTKKEKAVGPARNDVRRHEFSNVENSQNKKSTFKKDQRPVVEDQTKTSDPVVPEEVSTKKPHKRGGRGKSKGNKKKEDNDGEDSFKDPFLQSAGKSKAGKEEGEEERMARIRARAGPSVEASSKPSKKSNSNSEKSSSERNKSSKKGKKAIAEATKEETSSMPKKRKAEEVNKSHAEESMKKTKIEEKEKPKLQQPEGGEKKEDVSSVARVVNVSKAKWKNVEKKPNIAFEFTKKKQSISNGLQLGSGGAWK